MLGQTAVFKVVSARREGTQTVLAVTDPGMDEVFETLVIRGDFTASPEQSTGPRDPNAQLPQAISASSDFSRKVQLSAGAATVSSTMDGRVSAAVDYEYQRGRGGLQSADIRLSFSSEVHSTVAIRTAGMQEIQTEVLRVRIPIPVSVVDGALNFIGVRVVSVVVPVSLGISSSSEFDMSFSQVVTLEGATQLGYTRSGGVSLSESFQATLVDADLLPVTPGGTPVLATFRERLGLFVKLSPGLAFLETVALAGVQARLTAVGTAALQIVADTPFNF